MQYIVPNDRMCPVPDSKLYWSLRTYIKRFLYVLWLGEKTDIFIFLVWNLSALSASNPYHGIRHSIVWYIHMYIHKKNCTVLKSQLCKTRNLMHFLSKMKIWMKNENMNFYPIIHRSNFIFVIIRSFYVCHQVQCLCLTILISLVYYVIS